MTVRGGRGRPGPGPILPGATVGVFGGGQLGRMLAFEAHRLGYRVGVFAPEPSPPAAQAADWAAEAPFEDEDAVRAFACKVDVLTVEFENVPVAALRLAARHAPVRPAPEVQEIAQNRAREKAFLRSGGFPVAPHALVDRQEGLAAALELTGVPAVLKTAGFGYDGKGQRRVGSAAAAGDAWASLGGGPAVLEAWVEHRMELSVLVARDGLGNAASFPALENRHRNHILDLSLAPAEIDAATAAEADDLARSIAEELGLVGLLCVEFFLGEDGRLLVNEIAPRPHNSGHLTLEAAAPSQYELQLRAVCGLPLVAPWLHRPAAMANLLGDLWRAGEPDWAAALGVEGVALHLYGKGVAREGRKMGHLTAVAGDRAEAERRALTARAALSGGSQG